MHLRIPMVVAALVAGRKSLLPFGWRRTLLKVLAIPVILAGCGGSSPATPAAPTYVQVGGTWRGPVRATQLTGGCAESLQFIVGSSTTYTYTLQQNGANVSGVLQVRSATCEVSGIAVAGARVGRGDSDHQWRGEPHPSVIPKCESLRA